MKKGLMAILFGLLFVLGACGGSDDQTVEDEAKEEVVDEEVTEEESKEVEEGAVVDPEELVKDHCASCHTGDFQLVAGESEQSFEEMKEIILEGIGSMPAIEVTEEEADAISEYLVK